MSPIAPFLLQADDNPEGLPAQHVRRLHQGGHGRLPAWMKASWTTSTTSTNPRNARQRPGLPGQLDVAASASAIAGVAASRPGRPTSARTSRRSTCPMLVIQGDADRMLPSSRPARGVRAVKDAAGTRRAARDPWTTQPAGQPRAAAFVGSEVRVGRCRRSVIALMRGFVRAGRRPARESGRPGIAFTTPSRCSSASSRPCGRPPRRRRRSATPRPAAACAAHRPASTRRGA